MAQESNQTDAKTRRSLEHFLFGSEPVESSIPPRGLDRTEIVEYLDDRLERSMQPQAYWRVRDLCDAYLLVEALPILDRHVESKPRSSEEYVISLAIAMTQADLGDTAIRAKALDYYEKTLVTNAEAHPYFERLIECFAGLGPESTSQSLRQAIERRMKQLEPQIEKDYERRIEHLELQALLDNEVPAAEDGSEIKKRILAMKNRTDQVREWVKIYLGIEYGGGIYIEPWAIRMLRRLGTAGERQQVVKELRQALAGIEKQSLPKEEVEFVRRKVLRAIDYFDGALEPEERKFLDRFKGQEDAEDELSNE